MKKRLEADLISIAHRILQLKDKSDINQLYLETQKLYEKLAVLRFIEENYADVKPTIGSYSEIEKDIENIYNKEEASLPIETQTTQDTTVIEETPEEIQEPIATETPEAPIETESPDDEIPSEEIIALEEAELESENNDIEFEEQEPEIEAEEEIQEEIEEKATEEVVEIPAFKAAFELTQEPEETKKPEPLQISFEELLGLDYSEPDFVKVDEIPVASTKEIVFEAPKTEETPIEKAVETAEKTAPKATTLNDKFSKGIEIDLNDRIAFVKHLFGNSNEDYNRVMSQLITFDNFYETKSFIDDMVKPDYNNWQGKEEYEDRFMEIIEKKFL
ncbi:hypothetical protein [Flavobacterium flavipallidum]|uniref:DUF4476 domain-containing protein n=1 Tax=Flavobacterium flavipallidum TaxID=3139140 RepID=A0ABU9HNS3_9FLAO